MAWLAALTVAALTAISPRDSIEVVVHGTLRTGIMAIGGESTGTTITARGATWELDLRGRPEWAAKAESLSGKRVLVKGSLEVRPGVERRQRWIVTVKTLEAARGDPSTVTDDVRHDWTTEAVEALYHLPFPELLYRAQTVHRRYHDPAEVQRCTLLSIKTGGCPEDCGYCPQSAHYDAGIERRDLMDVADVAAAAEDARASGSTRFCMGAAWREARDGAGFDRVLEMVEAVGATGMEVCTTLGMLTETQARRLKAAGLTAYNHNLDTSPEFYPTVITTRTYQDRLDTLARVQDAGISVCCGGIVGMGESARDRCGLLAQLGRLDPHPESLPVNMLVRAAGTPLAGAADLDPLELVRTVACARLVAPRARVRLSAGRLSLTPEAQALCLLAGANSIFSGEKLLTTPNPAIDDDERLMARLGLRFAAAGPA